METTWTQTPAGALILLSLVSAAGLGLGHLRIRGVALGVGGVLFCGLAAGHAGLMANPGVLGFAQDLGLVLFVFSIGLQVGPGFADSLRRHGLELNAMAAGIVLLGTLLAIGAHRFAGVELPAAVGIFAGATTNTPSLAAATQAIEHVDRGRSGGPARQEDKLAGLGYAVAYPFGIIGTIGCMLLVRVLLRVDVSKELKELEALEEQTTPRLENRTIEVTNENFEGRTIADIPGLARLDAVISRVLAGGRMVVGRPDTRLARGALLHAVGTSEALEDLQLMLGRRAAADLKALPGPLAIRRIVVTDGGVLGKTVRELRLLERHGVTVTRITRSGIEFTPGFRVTLHFGDLLLCVGESHALDEAASELGNSARSLDHPQVLPIFMGIALGVLLGLVPIDVPGVPAPLRLGLAGGPLLVAIALGRLHSAAGLVFQLPASANLMLRELGICLFLAAVGIRSGDRFVEVVLTGDGLKWMLCGAAITFVPLLAAALYARLRAGLSYPALCGLLAGAMTDPPALAFASDALQSDLPYVSYATVYPLVMIMRLLAAQLLVFWLY